MVDAQHFFTFQLSSRICLLNFCHPSHSLLVSFACMFLLPVPYSLLLLFVFSPKHSHPRVLLVFSLFPHSSFIGTKVPGASCCEAQHPSWNRQRNPALCFKQILPGAQKRHKTEVCFSCKPISFSPNICELFPTVPTSIAKGKLSRGLSLSKTLLKRCISQLRDNQDGI